MISFILTNKSAIINTGTRTFSISDSHPMYVEIVDELKKGKNADPKVIEGLSSVTTALSGKTFGKVTVTDDAVYYSGKPVGNALTKRILQMLSEGFDIEPWALFMDNVMLNPVETAREELYRFLEAAAMPITPDGHFLAFKKVRDDLTSFYDEKTEHFLGKELSLPMDRVDTNYRNNCSSGLHFCSESYLSVYEGRGVVLLLKVNPKDVVAIPEDYKNAKGRAWKYTPLSIISRDTTTSEIFKSPVLGEVEGTETFADDVEVSPPKKTKKAGALYYDLTARQFLREIKKAGGARPYARANDLPKSSVQDAVQRARLELED